MASELYQEKASSKQLYLDPRTKILLCLSVSTTLIAGNGTGYLLYLHYALAVLPLIFLLILRKFKAALYYVTVYAFALFVPDLIMPYLPNAVIEIFNPLKSLYAESNNMTIVESCLDRIEELFAVEELPDKGKKEINTYESEYVVEYKNVCFSYGKKEVLHDVSFGLKENSMTALVGKSGSGKSTIANLLVRFWDINSGTIYIGGIDIKELPLSVLMNQISMVFQNVYLFEDTIYNNILMGRSDATEQEVIEAAKKARCYDFVMELPNGFQTIIGEGGASLSGGEKQRISIARCILKDAPIVILDEATASVDTDNESYIQEAISELVKGKTLLVIAHRLNTIQNADQILVIDNGQIAQQGTHEELLKQPGIYQDFVNIRKSAAGWSLA